MKKGSQRGAGQDLAGTPRGRIGLMGGWFQSARVKASHSVTEAEFSPGSGLVKLPSPPSLASDAYFQ